MDVIAFIQLCQNTPLMTNIPAYLENLEDTESLISSITIFIFLDRPQIEYLQSRHCQLLSLTSMEILESDRFANETGAE